MNNEYKKLADSPNSSDADIVLINKQIIDINKQLLEERDRMQTLADDAYLLWT